MVPELQQGGVFFQHVRDLHFYFVAQGLALWKTEKQAGSGQKVIQSEQLDLPSPPFPSFFGPVGPFGISD